MNFERKKTLIMTYSRQYNEIFFSTVLNHVLRCIQTLPTK